MQALIITHGWCLRRWRRRRWRTGRRSYRSGRGTIAVWTSSGTRWPCECWAPCGRASRSSSDVQKPELSINPSARWWDGRRWGCELQERRRDTYCWSTTSNSQEDAFLFPPNRKMVNYHRLNVYLNTLPYKLNEIKWVARTLKRWQSKEEKFHCIALDYLHEPNQKVKTF